MKTKTNLLIAIVALLSAGLAGFAQGVSSTNSPATMSTQDVFQVRFAATCQSFDTNRGKIVLTHITERDIIAEAVGVSPSDPTLTNQFALAYNAAADSLQVVDTHLLPVVDVIHFGGGAAIADNRQLDRFTFLFFPGQTNESGAETNVIGSAVITERASRHGMTGTNAGPNITGRLQYILTGDNVLGMTNPFPFAATSTTTNGSVATNTVGGTNGPGAVATTNLGIFTNFLSSGRFVMTNANIIFDPSAQICVGVFTTARAVPAVTPPSAPLGTNTNTVGTTNTTTGVARPPAGTTGTNGTNTGGMTTNATSGGVIGFNTVTGTTITNPGTANIGAGSVAGTPGVAGISGTTGTGMVGVTTTPGVTGTTGIGTGAGATPTGSGVITTGTGTVGAGTITTGAGLLSTGAVTTGTGTVGTGVIPGAGTVGTATTGTTGVGIPITTGF